MDKRNFIKLGAPTRVLVSAQARHFGISSSFRPARPLLSRHTVYTPGENSIAKARNHAVRVG